MFGNIYITYIIEVVGEGGCVYVFKTPNTNKNMIVSSFLIV